jgi:hypothetical protein
MRSVHPIPATAAAERVVEQSGYEDRKDRRFRKTVDHAIENASNKNLMSEGAPCNAGRGFPVLKARLMHLSCEIRAFAARQVERAYEVVAILSTT